MLTISIPDDIDEQLSSLTDEKEKFILNAIKQKIAAKQIISAKELAKEYADSIKENKVITEDYAFIDKEQWDDY